MLKDINIQLSLVFLLSTYLGATSLYKNTSGSFHFKWSLYIYCILLCSVFLAFGIYLLITYISVFTMSYSVILDIVYHTFNNFLILISLYQGYVKSNKLTEIIENLKKENDRLGSLKYGNIYISVFISLIGTNMIQKMVALIYFWYSVPWLTLGHIIYEFFIGHICIMLMSQYTLLMTVVGNQLTHITEQLQQTTFCPEVRHLIDIHHSLCLTAENINNVYDFFLLVALSLPFMITTLEVYDIILWFIRPKLTERGIFTSVFSVFTFVTIVFCIISVSAFVEQRAKSFNEQLFRLLLKSKSLSKDTTLQVYLAMKYNVSPTACDFFSLGYPLLTSMIAAAVTYVVMLIQFID